MAIGPISPVMSLSPYSPAGGLSPAEQQRLPDAVATVNSTAQFGDNTELRIVTDSDTHRPLIQLVDRDTREVVRQFPPKYVLRMAAELEKLAPKDLYSSAASASKSLL